MEMRHSITGDRRVIDKERRERTKMKKGNWVEAQANELGDYSARFEASQCMRGLTTFDNQIITRSRQDFAGGWSFGGPAIFHCGGTNRFIW
jgi:hypothetical protein